MTPGPESQYTDTGHTRTSDRVRALCESGGLLFPAGDLRTADGILGASAVSVCALQSSPADRPTVRGGCRSAQPDRELSIMKLADLLFLLLLSVCCPQSLADIPGKKTNVFGHTCPPQCRFSLSSKATDRPCGDTFKSDEDLNLLITTSDDLFTQKVQPRPTHSLLIRK